MRIPEGAVPQLTEENFVHKYGKCTLAVGTIFPLSEVDGTEKCPERSEIFVEVTNGWMNGNDKQADGQQVATTEPCEHYQEVKAMTPKDLCKHTSRLCKNCIIECPEHGFVHSKDGNSKVLVATSF